MDKTEARKRVLLAVAVLIHPKHGQAFDWRFRDREGREYSDKDKQRIYNAAQELSTELFMRSERKSGKPKR